MSNRRNSQLRQVLRRARGPYRRLRWALHRRFAIVWRSRLRDTIFLGVTGSYGKTTATKLLHRILTTQGSTSLGVDKNSPKDTAITILRSSPRRYRYCLQEVSGHEPGAVEDAVEILQPDIGIVTAIGGDHRKAFRPLEAIAQEKAKLVHAAPADGLAILNGDDPLVAAMASGCKCRVVVYGGAESADLRLHAAISAWPDRLTLEASHRGERFTVETQFVGVHWATSILAALAAALEIGVPRSAALEAIAAFEPVFNRMSVHPAPRGAWYVLDAFKASYSGIEACLGFLDEATAQRKTAIIGTISDRPAGGDRKNYNRVARMALARADRVFFTGPKAASTRRLARGEFADRLLVIEDPDDAVRRASQTAIENEVIYVKGTDEHLLINALVGSGGLRWNGSQSFVARPGAAKP